MSYLKIKTMKKLVKYLAIVLFISFQLNNTFGQEIKRDTTLFNEHQVVFEKMDYIPAEFPVQIYRTYKNDTTILTVYSDPYWISSMVSNKEYNKYLNAIRNDSSEVYFQKALPKTEIQSQKIEALNITLKEYYTNIKYEHYPVLGLSCSQAQNFCMWKTKHVNKELDDANLPHEKMYRIPIQAEIEGAKKFTDINLPRIFKSDSTYNNEELTEFYSKINEWTGENFVELTYLKGLSYENESEQIVVYKKSSLTNTPFKHKDSSDLNIGFRYVQTYRNVPNSK
jgi:hypothetical protein